MNENLLLQILTLMDLIIWLLGVIIGLMLVYLGVKWGI